MNRTQVLQILQASLMPRILDREEAADYVRTDVILARLEAEFGLTASHSTETKGLRKRYYDVVQLDAAVDRMSAAANAAKGKAGA